MYENTNINIFENLVFSESHIFFHDGIVKRQIKWMIPYLLFDTNIIDIKLQNLKNHIKSINIKEFVELEKYTMDDYRLFLSWSGYILYSLLPDEHYKSFQCLLELVYYNRLNFISNSYKEKNIILRKKWRDSLLECQYLVTPFPKLFKETWTPKMKEEFGRTRGVDDAYFETFHIDSKELSDRKNCYTYITKQSQINFSVNKSLP